METVAAPAASLGRAIMHRVAQAILAHVKVEHRLYRWRTVRILGERVCVYYETSPERHVDVFHVVQRLPDLAQVASGRRHKRVISPARARYYRVNFHTATVVEEWRSDVIERAAQLYDRVVGEEDARRDRVRELKERVSRRAARIAAAVRAARVPRPCFVRFFAVHERPREVTLRALLSTVAVRGPPLMLRVLPWLLTLRKG